VDFSALAAAFIVEAIVRSGAALNVRRLDYSLGARAALWRFDGEMRVIRVLISLGS
jgi:hypothetical protein